MKTNEIYALWTVLNELSKEKQPIKFSYCIAKNKNIIKREINILQKSIKISKELNDYDRKRIEISQKYSLLDENKKPIIKNNKYSINPEKKEEYENEINNLKNEYKEIIEEHEKTIEEYNNLECDFKPHKIKFENLPNEIKPKYLEILISSGIIWEDE